MHKTVRHTAAGRSWRRRAALALLAPLALVPSGCFYGLFEGVKSDVPIGRGTVAVMPFATPTRTYFESPLGEGFGTQVAEIIRKGCPASKVLGPLDLPQTVRGRQLAQIPLKDLGKALGADYMLIGEILELRAKEPKTSQFLKGTMVLSARVVDVKAGKAIWQIERRTYHYPALFANEIVPADERDEETVLKKVMIEAARGVAEPFTGTKEPDTGMDRFQR